MDWQECKNKKFVKEINVDKNLIKSLIGSSEKKFKTNKRIKIDETTASTKVSIIYEALRGILEALAIKKGFKIYNHECFCSFLYEICNDKIFSLKFDKLRRIRNQINYYGKDISVNEAKNIIKDIALLRQDILNKYFKKGEK